MKPTIKQKKFINGLVKTGNITKAALEAYETDNSQVAYQVGYRNLRNPTVISYMDQVLSNSGLDDATLTQELNKIIKASTDRQNLQKASPSDGLRGIELAFRLKDRFPAERKRVGKMELRVDLGKKSTKELMQLLDDKLKEAKKFKLLLAQGQNRID